MPKMRFRKSDPVHNLYAAVQHYVEAKGGRIMVIGGIQVQEWPDALPGCFTIGIKCTGRKPELKEKTVSREG